MSAEVSRNHEEMFASLLADKTEPLHPDLVPYLRESETFGTVLKHPLMNEMFLVNGIANRVYAQKKAAYDAALAESDWFTALQIIERPWRCTYLIDLVLGRDEYDVPFPVTSLTDPEMRDLVAWVWCDSENINEHVDEWLAITSGHTPGEPLLFGDQPAFDALALDSQGRIEVWRGDCDDGGWSWTLDRGVAEFFCARWDENNDLLHGFVQPHHVFGYITNRSETEVMVRREHVQDLTRTTYPIREGE